MASCSSALQSVVDGYEGVAGLHIVDLASGDRWAVRDELVFPQASAIKQEAARAQFATFAVLTPLWIVVDVYFFPAPLCWWLAGLRLAASMAAAWT